MILQDDGMFPSLSDHLEQSVHIRTVYAGLRRLRFSFFQDEPARPIVLDACPCGSRKRHGVRRRSGMGERLEVKAWGL
jgi:hypothetical protein